MKEKDKEDKITVCPPSYIKLKGTVLYTSCATTAIQILDTRFGESWTNCHDQQTYAHVINAFLLDKVLLHAGDEIYFEAISDKGGEVCEMIDCAPTMTVAIRLVND
jgi:hypothetical protein